MSLWQDQIFDKSVDQRTLFLEDVAYLATFQMQFQLEFFLKCNRS